MQIVQKSRRPLYFSVGLHVLLVVALIVHLPSLNYRLPGPVVQAHLINLMPTSPNHSNSATISPPAVIQQQQQMQKQIEAQKEQALAVKQQQLANMKAQAEAKAQAQAQAKAAAAAQAKIQAEAKAKAQAIAQAKAKSQAIAEAAAAKAKAVAVAQAQAAIKQHQQQTKALQLQAAKQKQQQALKALAAKQKLLQQQLLQQQLTGEQNQLTHEVSQLKSQQAAAVQAQANQGIVDQYKAQIVQAIEQQWSVPDATDPNLNCLLLVHVAPGGAVLGVQILRSSGNSALDQSAETAVYKASPLPVPKNPAIFDNFRELRLTVSPKKIIQS